MTTMMRRRCLVPLLVNVALLCLVDIQCFSPGAASSRITTLGGGSESTLWSSLHRGTNHDNNEDDKESTITTTRRRILLVETAGMLLSSTLVLMASTPPPSDAAPPIAIIAEELGYFPVTNRNGDTVYVPKRVRRTSSPQSIDLAKHLQKSGAVMYGAYWCPHCARQRELFGTEAWNYITYIECSPKGYNASLKLCQNVSGFPTWSLGDKEEMMISGQVPLQVLADKSHFKSFDPTLEEDDVPPLIGGRSACRQ